MGWGRQWELVGGLSQEVPRGNDVRGGQQDGGRVEVPFPSFLPFLVICSKPSMDGATESPNLFYSAPECCLAMDQVRAYSLLSQIWVQFPALHWRTVVSSSK